MTRIADATPKSTPSQKYAAGFLSVSLAVAFTFIPENLLLQALFPRMVFACFKMLSLDTLPVSLPGLSMKNASSMTAFPVSFTTTTLLLHPFIKPTPP